MMRSVAEGGERGLGHCDFWADKDADIVRVSPTVNVASRSHKNSRVNMHTLQHASSSVLSLC